MLTDPLLDVSRTILFYIANFPKNMLMHLIAAAAVRKQWVRAGHHKDFARIPWIRLYGPRWCYDDMENGIDQGINID